MAHFGDLADQWWDEQGAFRTLHAINPLRLEWISHHAPLTGQRVLDVGCGGGTQIGRAVHQCAIQIKQNGVNVHGQSH